MVHFRAFIYKAVARDCTASLPGRIGAPSLGLKSIECKSAEIASMRLGPTITSGLTIAAMCLLTAAKAVQSQDFPEFDRSH